MARGLMFLRLHDGNLGCRAKKNWPACRNLRVPYLKCLSCKWAFSLLRSRRDDLVITRPPLTAAHSSEAFRSIVFTAIQMEGYDLWPSNSVTHYKCHFFVIFPPAKLRDLNLLLVVCVFSVTSLLWMDVIPKKVVGCNLSCLLCSKSIEKRERIRVFGKSSVNISNLICCALDVDFNNVVNPVDIYICTKCYKRLIRFEKARNNFEELKDEIKRNYQGNDHIRTKRLHKSPDKVEQEPSKKRFNSAAKSLRFSENEQTLIAPTTTITPTIDTGGVISALSIITGLPTVVLSTFLTPPVPVATSTPATSTFTKPNTGVKN